MFSTDLCAFFILYIIISSLFYFSYSEDVCLKDDLNNLNNLNNCRKSTKETRYLFYDINQPEGFNLRRDVYMRLAVFMHEFKEKNWKLVLPPWPRLYHWRTKLINQDKLAWYNFFDISSLKQYAPIIEMYEFFEILGKENSSFEIDSVFVLQHYKEAFINENWTWKDKWSFESCNVKHQYEKIEDIYDGWFWGYKNITSRNVECVSFQGGASLLQELLEVTDGRYIMLDHAEVVLHDNFGNKQYWQCRQSMKFAHALIEEALHFRKFVLKISDAVADNVKKKVKERRRVKGDQYLCAHLRRRDFIAGRPDEIPTIVQAAKQVANILLSLNLTTVFVATDSPHEEKMELKKLLNNFTVVYYTPDMDSLLAFKDGGVAIIEQIICSHARYFVGSYESTFSFRIQEEREILGFTEDTTFNRLCGANTECKQPSKWKIQI